MSRTTSRTRWLGTLAVTGFAATAVLFGTAVPASAANTNFDGDCETSESCIWQGDIYEVAAWDYESTDSNLSNNYYKKTGAKVNDNSGGVMSFGSSCTAAWGNNSGSLSNSTKTVKIAVGGQAKTLLRTVYEDVISSHHWQC
ncbi:hypothetical protein FB565_006396 [Actinoplanes lutulentus]|uniref:Peptidase inhibitor family I36 n=1 Tax=Actinoplanes lutulentus TaxID=1287878 RepID=A0A327Z6V6_9ACTN|nr:hypothetical protein [Actinoplanes lutulentus]MBB2946628.1 hypothetical protein [Actinoplanes lutulentus]RAK26546.1 hypothetical protein B0I29_127136 [Actinoplanes lutulentus]